MLTFTFCSSVLSTYTNRQKTENQNHQSPKIAEKKENCFSVIFFFSSSTDKPAKNDKNQVQYRNTKTANVPDDEPLTS